MVLCQVSGKKQIYLNNEIICDTTGVSATSPWTSFMLLTWMLVQKCLVSFSLLLLGVMFVSSRFLASSSGSSYHAATIRKNAPKKECAWRLGGRHLQPQCCATKEFYLRQGECRCGYICPQATRVLPNTTNSSIWVHHISKVSSLSINFW